MPRLPRRRSRETQGRPRSAHAHGGTPRRRQHQASLCVRTARGKPALPRRAPEPRRLESHAAEGGRGAFRRPTRLAARLDHRRRAMARRRAPGRDPHGPRRRVGGRRRCDGRDQRRAFTGVERTPIPAGRSLGLPAGEEARRARSREERASRRCVRGRKDFGPRTHRRAYRRGPCTDPPDDFGTHRTSPFARGGCGF